MSTHIPPFTARTTRRFDYLPVALFGSVMGLTGLSIAWALASARFDVPLFVSRGLAAVACATFVLLVGAYATKAITALDVVKTEFRHPIAGSLFGTVFISLLLLPIVVTPFSLAVARAMWAVGAIGMLGFAIVIVKRWTGLQQDMTNATPPWIVPVVGLLDIPLAVPSLQLPFLHETMVLGLAVGLFFALPLFTLIFARLVFQTPLPEALQPSLFILLAPFSVGMSAYVATTGRVDVFAQALFAIGVFLLAVLFDRLRHLGSCCPFRVAWWAVSFPLAATAVAALRVDVTLHTTVTSVLAVALLGVATITIGYLFVRTWIGIFRGELRALST